MTHQVAAMRRRTVPLISLALALVSLAGCQNVRYMDIDSNPSNANIYVDGVKVGVTPYMKVPLDYRSDTEKRVFIQIVKYGSKPKEAYYRIESVPEDPVRFDLDRD